ncbi:ATPdependent RNA helicase [Chytridiales sp. JEL 0842]|nr:ATPdependent RNA helicase [Chytridiales sp. JEL 0842]
MSFWKPGTVAPGKLSLAFVIIYDLLSQGELLNNVIAGSSVDREALEEGSTSLAIYSAALQSGSLIQQRQSLPIYKSKQQILYLIDRYQTDGFRKDNTLAATSVATRVAEEMGVPVGDAVGYAVRFDEAYGPNTKIKYMTDGMLLREALLDPLLKSYSAIMVDEAHERSLHTDVLLGILKKVAKKRPELRIIISSATLDAEAFCEYFNLNENQSTPEKDTSVIVSIEGRMFPVEVFYLAAPCTDYIQKCVETVLEIHKKEKTGDILVFLTGKDDIDTATSLLSEYNQNDSMAIVPLYGGLPLEEQLKVFAPPSYSVRKVIFATNIAEASITVEGILYVIDAGLVKLKAYNPKTSLESLIVVPISKAAAQQRAGRAGRTAPGKTFRLYTEQSFNALSDNTVPEMQRSELSAIVLQLKALGIDNVLRFDFLTPPSSESLARALELLYSMKAIDDYGRLTIPSGVQLAELPVHPVMASMLLSSANFNCSEEIITIAAMLSVQVCADHFCGNPTTYNTT